MSTNLQPAHPGNTNAVKSGVWSRTGRVLAPRAAVSLVALLVVLAYLAVRYVGFWRSWIPWEKPAQRDAVVVIADAYVSMALLTASFVALTAGRSYYHGTRSAEMI